MNLKWDNFKNFVSSTSSPIYMAENNYFYNLFVYIGAMSYQCNIEKSATPDADQVDFETNYLPTVNPKSTDGNNDQMFRLKMAKRGNYMRCHSMQIETSNISSLKSCSDDDITSDPWFTAKFKKDLTTDCTDQTDADSNCILTEINFKSDVSIESIEAKIYQPSVPASSVRLYGTLAPSLPGGDKKMCHGGLDLSYMGSGLAYQMDGRTPKELVYFEGTDYNLLRIRLFHSAGLKHKMQLNLLYYLS